jgi:hypothetical protein
MPRAVNAPMPFKLQSRACRRRPPTVTTDLSLELIMTTTPNPIPAVLAQLAAAREQLDALNAREASHHCELLGQVDHVENLVTDLRRALAEDTAVLGRLDDLDTQVTERTRHVLTPAGGDHRDSEGYAPRPAPAWWKLADGERPAPVREVGDWVEHVYQSAPYRRSVP